MLALWWLTVGFAGPITRPLSSRHASPLVAAGPARFGSVRLAFLLPQLSAVWLIVVLSSPSPWGVGGVCWKREPGFFSAGSKKRALELLVPFRTRALKLLQEAAERPPKAGGATPPFWRVAPPWGLFSGRGFGGESDRAVPIAADGGSGGRMAHLAECTNLETKAEPQQIVAQGLLSCLQYPVS